MNRVRERVKRDRKVLMNEGCNDFEFVLQLSSITYLSIGQITIQNCLFSPYIIVSTVRKVIKNSCKYRWLLIRKSSYLLSQ